MSKNYCVTALVVGIGMAAVSANAGTINLGGAASNATLFSWFFRESRGILN